jgi:NAD(P)-dependent dehydrogenase (short-subunit alcohol dehydrogenase family)
MPTSPLPTVAARPVVLVTGAAKRLGREIALTLAGAGWDVAVHYRGSAPEARQTAADCVARGSVRAEDFHADLAKEADVRALVPRIVARFGRIDAVVNSASLFEHDTVEDFGIPALDAHLHVNTGAAILLAQALHAHLAMRDGRGVVVNLLDQKLHNLNPDFFSYTLSKAALEAANTMLALALAPRVRVVGVAPGLTLGNPLLEAERFEQLHRQSPLGRSSTPADIAHAVKFALENPALTGTTLVVDGGQHLVRQSRDFALMPVPPAAT